jgi:hypothetical protein
MFEEISGVCLAPKDMRLLQLETEDERLRVE